MADYEISDEVKKLLKKQVDMLAELDVEKEDFNRVGPVTMNGKKVLIEDWRKMLAKGAELDKEETIKAGLKELQAFNNQIKDGKLSFPKSVKNEKGEFIDKTYEIKNKDDFNNALKEQVVGGNAALELALSFFKGHNVIKNRLEDDAKVDEAKANELLALNKKVSEAATKGGFYSKEFIEWRGLVAEEGILKHKEKPSEADKKRLGELPEKIEEQEKKLKKPPVRTDAHLPTIPADILAAHDRYRNESIAHSGNPQSLPRLVMPENALAV